MSHQEQLQDIAQPHANDVLSGRGNFVNHHTGNENFRALVKHHKKAYVACPKNQKAIYSKLIYDEIRSMNPPGRFLKQDPKTKLWSDIGEKKALDKTRQALREGAPEIMKELDGNDKNSHEKQDGLGPLRDARQNNPLANSLMGNISLGSFSLSSIDPHKSADNGSSTPGIPGQIQTNNNGLTQERANALFAAATQMQLQQQQQQQQQLQFLQQQAGNMSPAQLQLLQNHLQMNQQQQQQQNNAGFNNMAGGNNMFPLGNNGGYDAALAAAQASSNMGSEQVAALLNAIHNNAANNSASGMLQQQLSQQLMTQNFLNQMNNANNSIQTSNQGNNNNQNPQQGLNTNQNATQNEDTTVPVNAAAQGTSSIARAQRIGLKNSFTQNRRPSRHIKSNEQALMANSLMSVESINMDQLRMSGVSLGEFTGSEMCKLFESDRDMGKAKDKTDDVSEVSDAMSEDAMSEDGKN